MAECFLHEGEHFLHQSYSGCEFHANGSGCRYCTTKSPRVIASPDEVRETVIAACNENPNYHVALGGGYTMDEQSYFDYFLSCIQKIRQENKQVPIWVEMIPPTEKQIEQLVDAGATSLGLNIEIWNDEKRKEICPGKFALRTKEEYLDRMKFALGKLGKNKVGSVLIAGLECANDTKQGIDVLTANGIHPCILSFKPWNESALKDKKHCTPELFYEVSEYAALAITEHHLDLQANQGCLLCDCCTVVHDIFKLNY